MNIQKDMNDLIELQGVREWLKRNPDRLDQWLNFRMDLLREEFKETTTAHNHGVADEVVDGMIDLMVVASGTLVAMGVSVTVAWDRVHRANMSKTPGRNPSRPNPLGVPDLVKPDNWQEPVHSDNTGGLDRVYSK
jgi:hypothetical protein